MNPSRQSAGPVTSSFVFPQGKLIAEHRFLPPIEIEAGSYRLKIVGMHRRRVDFLPGKDKELLFLQIKPEAKQGKLPENFQLQGGEVLEDDKGRWNELVYVCADLARGILPPHSKGPSLRNSDNRMFFLGFKMPKADVKQIRRFHGFICSYTEGLDRTFGPIALRPLSTRPVVKNNFAMQIERFGSARTALPLMTNPLPKDGQVARSHPGHRKRRPTFEATLLTLEPTPAVEHERTCWLVQNANLRDNEGTVQKFQRWQSWEYPGLSSRVVLGITIADIDFQELKRLGVPGGVKVVDVIPSSPAQRAGIKKGDIILGVGEQTVRVVMGQGVLVLGDMIRKLRPGQSAPVRLLRKDKRLTLTATLSRLPVILPTGLSEWKAKQFLRQLSSAAGEAHIDKSRLHIGVLQTDAIEDKRFAPTSMSVTFRQHELSRTPFAFQDIPLPQEIMEAK